MFFPPHWKNKCSLIDFITRHDFVMRISRVENLAFYRCKITKSQLPLAQGPEPNCACNLLLFPTSQLLTCDLCVLLLYSAKKGQIILDIGESVAIGDQFTTFPVSLQLCKPCQNLLLHLALGIGEWRQGIGDILGQFARFRRSAQDDVGVDAV